MPNKSVVYAGTFDPITAGHVDVVKRALSMFDSVIVAVADNSRKKALFSKKERVELVKKSLKGLKGVKVESFNGLLVDYVKKKNVKTLLRGMREMSDFEYEFQQALMNRKLYPEIDTVFVMTSPKYFYVSSSIVKEIARLGGDLGECTPEPVRIALKKKLRK